MSKSKRGSFRPPSLHLPLRTIATSNTLSSPAFNVGFLKMNSPMTNLAHNLSELSTGRGTPRRKLSLSSIDTPPASSCIPTPERMSSTESGCFTDSPTPLDSPTLEMSIHRFAKHVKPEIPPEAFTKKKTIAFRRLQSYPLPVMRLSPTDFMDKENAKEMLRFDVDSDHSSEDAGLHPPKFYIDETSSSQDSGISFEHRDFSGANIVPPSGAPDSPLKFNPLTSCDDDEEVDDGFLDCMDGEVAEITSPGVSDTMATLFKAPVINHTSMLEDEESPVIRRTSRFLNRSQSFDVRSRLSSFKRDTPCDDSTPTQSKRRRSCLSSDDCSPSTSLKEKLLPKPKLVRCHSESEALIKSALARSATEDLIADCSMPYCLPTVQGKHSDLKCIDCKTMSKVLNKDYDHMIESCTVVDCRYPYEYDGGHIQGAKNLYTKEDILSEFMKKAVSTDHTENRRNILIFHCEFSSERGPKLLKFLRKMDRDTNKECYPALYYPEIYLLEGGYKNFYETHKDLCEPISYKPMLHKDHGDDLRHFRAKSKSWAGEKIKTRPGFRPLMF